MKIALCLSGHFRDYQKTIEGWKKILNMMDVYIVTYNNVSNDNNSRYLDVTNIDKEEIIRLFKPKKYLFLDQINFDISKFPNSTNGKQERTLGMYYLIEKCFNLIDEEYDLVIRARPDMFITQELVDTLLKVNLSKLSIFNRADDIIVAQFSDILFCGSFNIMKKVCSLYSNIEKVYDEIGILCPHLCLTHFVKEIKNDIYVVDNDILVKR